MISACEKGGQWQKAFELFDELQRRGLEPEIITYNAMISNCEKGGQWEKALELFDELQQRGLKPDVITYNALISACENDGGGQWEQAFELFGDLKRRGLEPTVITYNAMISACEKGGQWDKALELFEELQQRGLEPTLVTYDAMISASETTGHLKEACLMFLEAYERQYYPQLLTRGLLDLHDLSAAVARTAVRAALEDLLRSPDERKIHLLPSRRDFGIITGRGNRSVDGEPIVRQAILALLREEYAQLHCVEAPENPGRLVLSGRSLRDWTKAMGAAS